MPQLDWHSIIFTQQFELDSETIEPQNVLFCCFFFISMLCETHTIHIHHLSSPDASHFVCTAKCTTNNFLFVMLLVALNWKLKIAKTKKIKCWPNDNTVILTWRRPTTETRHCLHPEITISIKDQNSKQKFENILWLEMENVFTSRILAVVNA